MAILYESGGTGSKPLTKEEIAAQVAAEKARAEAAQTNAAARRSTEAYASPFSTAFGGTAPSTAIDAVREYASPFSTAFGGSAPATPYTPSQMVGPTGSYTGSAAAPVSGGSTGDGSSGAGGSGNSGAGGSGNKPVDTTISQDTRDAFALLEQTFRDYGLEELVPAIKGYMERNLGPNQATLELRKEPAYIARFKGNETRRAAGLNALSEAEYLALEDSYSQTLRAYGVQNYFGSNAKARQKAMSDIIGNDISATEFKDRIDTVVTRVSNADAQIKETLKTFYDIKDEDLTSYFLNPKENLPKLQEKVTAAEIGAAAASQKLGYSKTSAEDLAKFGITKAQAIEGYSNIAEIMPTASKLGEIYNDKYTQDTAEQEVFKGSASAKRKRQQLAEREAAAFSGSSGRMRTGKAQGNTGSF